MKKTAISLGKLFFMIRGLTPIPLYIICLVYSRIELNFFLSGLLLIGFGEILRFFSVGYLGVSSRKTENAETNQLVISGPYRFVRNPIYLGNMSIYLGFAVLSNVFFPAFSVITVVFFMFAYYLIVCYEENVLRIKFDRDYEKYLTSVPRFIPLLLAKHQIASGHKFDPAKAVRSEKTTLIVLTLALTALLVKHYTL